MGPEWLSLLASSGAALTAILAFPKMRDILRAVFRRPRETTVIVQVGKKKAQVGTGQVLMRGTPKDPEELRKFVEQIMREVEQPPKPEGVDGSGATTGSDADE